MRREFEPFDDDVIRKELDELPSKDAAKLVALMRHYEQCGTGNPAPAQIDDYGHGIYRLRHVKSAYSGRVLYFASQRVAGFERLVILVVYKKEEQKLPAGMIALARNRRRLWQNRHEE